MNMGKKVVFFLSMMLAATFAVAVETPAALPREPVDMTANLIKVTFGLGLVVVAIFVAAWFFKRMGKIGPVQGSDLRVLGGLNVGNRERVVLLQVGEQQVLIGVTPENVRTLHVLAEPIPMMQNSLKPPLENFSQKLNQAMSQWKNRTR